MMELEKWTAVVGISYDFCRTPPESQEERRDDRYWKRTEEFTRCQSESPPGSGNTGGYKRRGVKRWLRKRVIRMRGGGRAGNLGDPEAWVFTRSPRIPLRDEQTHRSARGGGSTGATESRTAGSGGGLAEFRDGHEEKLRA